MGKGDDNNCSPGWSFWKPVVGFAATTNRYENINIVVPPTATPFNTEPTPTLNPVQEVTPEPGQSVPSEYPSPKGQKQSFDERLDL